MRNLNSKNIISEFSAVVYPLIYTNINILFQLGNIDYLDLFIDKVFGSEVSLFYLQNSRKNIFSFCTRNIDIFESLEFLVELKKILSYKNKNLLETERDNIRFSTYINKIFITNSEYNQSLFNSKQNISLYISFICVLVAAFLILCFCHYVFSSSSLEYCHVGENNTSSFLNKNPIRTFISNCVDIWNFKNIKAVWNRKRENIKREENFINRLNEMIQFVKEQSYESNTHIEENISEKLSYITRDVSKKFIGEQNKSGKCKCGEYYVNLIRDMKEMQIAMLQETITLTAVEGKPKPNPYFVGKFKKNNKKNKRKFNNIRSNRGIWSLEAFDQCDEHTKEEIKNYIEENNNKREVRLNKYIQFEESLLKQNFTFLSFENIPNFRRYNKYNQVGEWMERIETGLFPTLKEIKECGDEVIESWRKDVLDYYKYETNHISRNCKKSTVKGIRFGYIFNLNDMRVRITDTQMKEVGLWFNKKYFQVFGGIFHGMETRKSKNPHFFYAELRALKVFLAPHLKFLTCHWGEFKRFEIDVANYFCKEMRDWKNSECTEGVCWA